MKTITSFGAGFSVATARSPESAGKYIAELGLTDPVAFYNGAKIWDPLSNQFLFSDYLDPKDAELVIIDIIACGLKPIIHCYDSRGENRVIYTGIYNDSEDCYFSDRIDSNPDRFQLCSLTEINEVILDKNVIDIVFVGDQSIARHVDSSNHTTYVSEDVYCRGYFWVEVMPDGANKGKAASRIKSSGNWKNLISFGDNVNDIAMFEQSDISCFVNGGDNRARISATTEILSNDQCGVAKWIKSKWLS